jgi:hypothetical protein
MSVFIIVQHFISIFFNPHIYTRRTKNKRLEPFVLRLGDNRFFSLAFMNGQALEQKIYFVVVLHIFLLKIDTWSGLRE